MRRRSHLLSAGLGLCLLTFAPGAHATTGTDGSPGDPGLSVTTSGDATVGTYTGTDGGNGTPGYPFSGFGGHGGAGAQVSGNGLTVNFTGGTYTGGHGGGGATGFFGGNGGGGGNGLDILSSTSTTNVHGGNFIGSAGGDAGSGSYLSGFGGNGGNAIFVSGSSNANVDGGVFQAGQAGAGGHDGVDFYVNGGTLNLLGTFDKPIVGSDGYGSITGTFSYNFGTLENVTYTFFDAGAGNLQVNGITEIKAVPEASSVVLFALLLTGGLITLRRRSAQPVTIA